MTPGAAEKPTEASLHYAKAGPGTRKGPRRIMGIVVGDDLEPRNDLERFFDGVLLKHHGPEGVAEYEDFLDANEVEEP